MVLTWVLTTLFLIVLASLVYYYCTRNFNYWKDRGVPYEKPRFFFGNLLDLFFGKETSAMYMNMLYNKFDSPYFGFFLLNQHQLVIKDPQIIKTILITDFQSFPNRSVYCDEKIDPMFSSSLAALNNSSWRALRAKLTPIFTSGKMKMMFALMNDCGKNLTDYLSTQIGNDQIEIREITSKYTTDIITSCAFGIDSNSFANDITELREAGKRMFYRSYFGTFETMCYFFAPTLVKVLKLKFIDPKAADILRKVFTETLRHRECSKIKRNDLIDILIDLKNKETADDEFKFYGDRLVSQAVTFFAAGQEASSSIISFALHELCLHTDIQDKVRTEILNVINEHGGLTYEAMQQMKYLDMVLSEVLRKYPIILLQRKAAANYKIPQTGLMIEKDTPIIIPVTGLHSDPKYFPNPEQFIPERFSNENKHNIPSGAYVPFGDGPRNCIGERFGLITSKLGIIHIIKDFKLERNANTKDILSYLRSPIIQPRGGIRMTVQKLLLD